MGKNAVMKNGMRPAGLKEQMNLETLDFNKRSCMEVGILTRTHSR
jgi:hypothetical protein